MTAVTPAVHRAFSWTARASACTALIAASVAAVPAHAGSFEFTEWLKGQYKLTLTYGAAMRMEDQAEGLINGPIDPLQFDPGGDPAFSHTGLPDTINFDDGNRGYRKYALINNRLSAFGELNFRIFDNFGAVFSGSTFYDRVLFEPHDYVIPEDLSDATLNQYYPGDEYDEPETVGAHNEFTNSAKDINGDRSRMLDAFVYADWWFDNGIALNLRYGRHLNAWGQSLFFPGIVTAQNPNDATKAFVPGVDVKEILLPVNQVSMQAGWGDYQLLGYYQLEYKPTEIFPAGDYFSPADVVGPGAVFTYGSINPLYADGCPGLFPDPFLGTIVCNQDGIGGDVFNAPPTINSVRGPDIIPDDKGQWGAGLGWQLTDITHIGAYYLKYHNHNPSVKLNMGYAPIGETPDGTPITTEAFDQLVPTSYQTVYADNITMKALSWTSVFFGINFAGEFIRRENMDFPIKATISGVVAPVYSRGTVDSAQVSLLYTTNPDFLIYDEIPIVGEFGYVRVEDVVPIPDEPGINTHGDGDVLFYDRESYAVSFLTLPKGRNVFSGWDLGTPISFSWLIEGTPSTSGQFGALYGEGDMRVSPGITLQYLQNLEFAFTYNWFFGDPDKNIDGECAPQPDPEGHECSSRLRENPYADRDYLSLTVKYNL